MPGAVCVDASLAIKWIFPEDLSDEATNLRRRWRADEITQVAPQLFPAEVTSIVRERAFRGELAPAEAAAVLERALRWPVRLAAPDPELQRTALEFASRFNHPKAHDAQYLALAYLLDCELWTGDKRLVNSLQGALPWVKWVGDFQA